MFLAFNSMPADPISIDMTNPQQGGWGACCEGINLVGVAEGKGRSYFMLALQPIDAKKPLPRDLEDAESNTTEELRAKVHEVCFWMPTP